MLVLKPGPPVDNPVKNPVFKPVNGAVDGSCIILLPRIMPGFSTAPWPKSSTACPQTSPQNVPTKPAQKACPEGLSQTLPARHDRKTCPQDITGRLARQICRPVALWPCCLGSSAASEQALVVAQDDLGGVVTGRAGDPAAGMGTGAAMVEAGERPAVVGVSEHGTGGKQLV